MCLALLRTWTLMLTLISYAEFAVTNLEKRNFDYLGPFGFWSGQKS